MNKFLTIIIFVIIMITGRFIAMIYRHHQKASIKKIFNDKTIFMAIMIPIVCI
jgi:CDP-diacylglycerol pyrophosphatase